MEPGNYFSRNVWLYPIEDKGQPWLPRRQKANLLRTLCILSRDLLPEGRTGLRVGRPDPYIGGQVNGGG